MFMQLTLGRARVGQLIHNCCLCLFILEKDCVYLDAEGLYNYIKRKTFQACSNFAKSNERGKRYFARSARSSNTRTKVLARCSLYHFISNSERNYVHAMS